MTRIRPYLFLPTWRWGVCTVVSFAMLLAAMNYQKNALHWLAYTCWSLLLYSSMYSWYVTRAWKWDWQVPAFAFATQPWTVSMAQPYSGAFQGGDISSYSNQIIAPNPGQVSLKAGVWSTEYPMGLFRTRFHVPPIPPVWVYPLPVNHRQEGLLQEIEWTHVREYQPGDASRHILKKTQSLPEEHWQVRSPWEDTKTHSLAYHALDWSRLPDHWSSEQRQQQLSFDIQRMLSTDVFDLILPTGGIGKGLGMEHKQRAWQALTLYAMTLDTAVKDKPSRPN